MISLVVISYAALFFIGTVCFLWDKGTEEDLKERRIKVINRRNSKDNVYNELDEGFFNRFVKPLIGRAKQSVEDASNKSSSKNASNEAKMEQVARKIRLAGLKIQPVDFLFIKRAALIIGAILGVFVSLVVPLGSTWKFIILLIFVVLGFVGPDFYLGSCVSGHQEGIRKQLPDAMDLLGACIEAGLSFDGALVKVAERMEGPFIDELIILYNQIQMGKPRNEALKQMAASSEIQELKTFLAALAQANELGIPINNVMEVQSQQLRETRRRIAQEKGLKAPVKMMIPMVTLIFPTILIVLMAPSAMNIMEAF